MKRMILISLLFIMLPIILFAKLTMEDVVEQEAIYHFDVATSFIDSLDTKTDIFKCIDEIMTLKLTLEKNQKISNIELIKAEKKLNKLKRKYKKKPPEFKIILLTLNNMYALKLMNRFYFDSKIEINNNDILYPFFHPIEQEYFPVGEEFVSSDFIFIYSYLLDNYGFKKEAEIVLKRIYKYRGYSLVERDYLYYLHLVLYSYIDGDYPKAKEYLNEIINKEVNANYYLYIKAIASLWDAIISYKENHYKQALSSYKKFLLIKDEIDNKNNYIVPIKTLISPTPGIFPPEKVYIDFENIQKLWENSK